MEYTKGEWKQYNFRMKAGHYIRLLANDYDIAVVPEYLEEHKANAHLITTAPDMYEEWQDLLCLAKSNPDKDGEWWRKQILRKAEPLLAKAEGRTQ